MFGLGAIGKPRTRRRMCRGIRTTLAATLGPVLAAGGLTLPPAAVAAAAVAGVAAVAAAGVAAAPAALASTPPGKALVLLQSGTTAPETTALQAAGWTVDQATPTAWAADSAATFKSYAVLVIGDPSTTSSCSTSIPTTATLGTTWQSAVSGNVAVLGTAPAAAGTNAAAALITASAGYAGAAYSGGNGTGLYVSLDCAYKTAAAGTAAPLLNGVEGTGTAGGLTVRGSLSCSDPGTVSKWEETAAGTFGAINNNSLAAGAWTSTGCPVQEAFSSWPAMYTPVAIDAAADATPANATTSNGTQGQPYVLLGHPVSTATAALAPGAGGEVPPQSAGDGSNPAAPGVSQATAGDPVNTENGDFTQSATDLTIPGYGPGLDFSRTYDAQAARRQTVTGTPGPLGYGWTDNWATSLTLQRPVPGDIYTVNTAGVLPFEPVDMVADAAGNVLYADAESNAVVEVAAATHTQFGIAMTAGHAYVVAGSSSGTAGTSGDGGPATSALLNQPWGLALDGSGNLFIADQINNRIQEVPAATGTQFGIAMTASDMYTVAGSAAGTSGSTGDGGAATAALLNTPNKVRVDHAGNLYISDDQNFRVQEVPVATGTQHGQSMTAADIYTITGQAGSSTYSGDGGLATSARFVSPTGLALDAAGDLYISDDYTDVVREIPFATGTQWGRAMTANDIYTIAGTSAVAGTGGSTGDGGPATSAQLNEPEGLGVDAAGDLYVGDTFNNRLQEVPIASGTQWSQSMTAGDMYTVIGASMTMGDTGDGGPATAAELTYPAPIAFDPSGNMLIPDPVDSEIREVFATSSQLFATTLAGTGITVNQADGSQVTFYPKVSGNCTAPYVAASGSGYCALPQYTSASLTYNSGAGTYTYTPAPGTSYTYNSTTGALKSVADAAGNTVTLTASSPASGRTLVLGFSSAGLVTSVTDPLARRWVYAYTGSQLTTVTDPMTNVTTYTYGAGSTGNPQLASDLLTMTAPNGQPGGSAAGKKTVNVYDAQGRVITQTDPMGFATTFNYCVGTAAGNCMDPATGTGLVAVTDPDGNKTVYDYQQGVLAATSTFTGSTFDSETDQQPDISSGTLLNVTTTDGNGATTTYTYNATGNRAQLNRPVATGTATTSSTYATQAAGSTNDANCTSAADAADTCQHDSPPAPVTPAGVITPPSSAPPRGTTYTLYDTDGNELYATTGVYMPGATTAAYSQTTYQLFKGNTVTLSGTLISCTATPPSQSLPCATVNADGFVTQLGYNSAGDLTSTATPDGNASQIATATYTFDADGEQTGATSPDGNLAGANAGNYTTGTAYNADGDKTSVSVAGGTGATVSARITAYTYDADRNQLTVKDPRSQVTTTTYNADDQRTLVTDPLSNATLTCYDGDGNAAQTVPPAGVAAGSLTPASCPASYPSGYSTRLASDATVTTFNSRQQAIKTTTPPPAGQSGYETTTYSYDGEGNLLITTAPPVSSGGASVVTVETYTPDGSLATKTTGYGTSAAATTSYCYNPTGQRTAVVPPDGNASGTAPCEKSSPWTVSPSANPAQAAYQTTYSYDSAAEQVSITTPATAAATSGATTTITYDPMGNKLTSTDANGVTITYTYTPLGKEATATYSGSSAHAVGYTYDADGSRTGMADGTGGSSYTLDPFGEITSETNGAGQVTGYTYDAAGDVATIVYPLPAAATWATSSTVTFSYYDSGNLSAVTDFNGNKITITDNADSRPTADALGTTGDTLSTTYDATGAPGSISLSNGSSTLQSFTYSDAPSGNILSETDTPASTSSPAVYTYDALSRVNSMTPGSNTALNYAFDASGNLTTLPTGAAGSYDHNSELTTSALGGTTTSYSYNADGERLGASQGGSSISTGTWNGGGQLNSYSDSSANMTAAAYDGDGKRASTLVTPAGHPSVTQGYLWAGNNLIMDSANAYIYAVGNAPAEQVNLTSGTVTYLVPDLLGSVRGAVGSTGALSGTTSYDAWGNPSNAGGLSGTTPFGFAGGYTDPTGLVYLINRYYDPSAGQFLSVDPDVSQTFQPYAYAAGNPISQADPAGLAAINLRAVSTWAYNNVYTAFHWFSGDDCTDFVSQALRAGGMTQYIGNRSATDDRNWFWFPSNGPNTWSHSWSVAYDMAVHLLSWKAQNLRNYNAGVQDGDVAFADWNSSSFSLIDHSGIVTGIQGNGMPYITQHNRDIRNDPLQYWLKNGGRNVHVWIMRPNQD